MSSSRRAPSWDCTTTLQPRCTVRCCVTTTSLVVVQGWASVLRLSVGRGRVAILHLAIAHTSSVHYDYVHRRGAGRKCALRLSMVPS
jgi:hypothetical protein